MTSYGSLCTRFYDLDKPEAPAEAFTWYLERARRCGGRVLEPMCGSGRFLLPLIRAGVPAEGTDASPQMLAACRRRAARDGLAVTLHEQSFERMALPHRYAMAFIPSGSIALVSSDADLRAGLERLRDHLEPGASLLLELPQSDPGDGTETADLDPRSVECEDGTRITYRCRAMRVRDPAGTRFLGVYAHLRGSEVLATEHEELLLRDHAPGAFIALLRDCGYVEARCRPAGDPAFAARSGCLLVEARTGG